MMNYFSAILFSLFLSSLLIASDFERCNNLVLRRSKRISEQKIIKEVTVKQKIRRLSKKFTFSDEDCAKNIPPCISPLYFRSVITADSSQLSHFNLKQMRKKMSKRQHRLEIDPSNYQFAGYSCTADSSKISLQIRRFFNDLYRVEQFWVCGQDFSPELFRRRRDTLKDDYEEVRQDLSERAQEYAQASLKSLFEK